MARDDQVLRHRLFRCSPAKPFVVVGDVLEGSVEAGMTVSVNLGFLNVATRGASMEVIDVDYLNKSYRGLEFGFDDPEELDFWACLKISDETLELELP